MPPFVVKVGQQGVVAEILATDKDGNATKDLGGGTLDWTSSDPTVTTVTPTDDPFLAKLEFLKPGNVQIVGLNKQLDGDEVSAVGETQTLAGEAAMFAMNFKTVEEPPA